MRRIFSMLLIVILLFSGCSAVSTEPESSPSSPEASPAGTGAVNGDSAGAGTNSLTLLKQYDDRGYYRFAEAPDGHGFLLCYTDFETAEVRVVCDIDGCAHEDEASCGAYRGSFHYVYVMGDRLVWLRTVEAPGYLEAENSADQGSYIGISARDGSGFEKLYSLDAPKTVGEKDIAFSLDSTVFYDGVNLYLPETETASWEEPREPGGTEPAGTPEEQQYESFYERQRRIVTINPATGETEKNNLPEEISGEMTAFFGMTEDRMVFATYEDPEPDAPPHTSRTDYYGFSPDDGRAELLYTHENSTASGTIRIVGMTGEGKLLGTVYGQMTVTDIETGETVVTGELPEEARAEYYTGYTHSIWDNRFFFAPWSLELEEIPGGKHFIFDTESGAVTENLMYSVSYEKGVGSVQIVAETETEFFVIAEFETREVTRTGTDGAPYNLIMDFPKYAMILKEDYYSGIPDYRFIENPEGDWML